jgi:hypothetical protein
MVIEMKKLDQQLTDVNHQIATQVERETTESDALSQDRDRLLAELTRIKALMAKKQQQQTAMRMDDTPIIRSPQREMLKQSSLSSSSSSAATAAPSPTLVPPRVSHEGKTPATVRPPSARGGSSSEAVAELAQRQQLEPQPSSAAGKERAPASSPAANAAVNRPAARVAAAPARAAVTVERDGKRASPQEPPQAQERKPKVESLTTGKHQLRLPLAPQQGQAKVGVQSVQQQQQQLSLLPDEHKAPVAERNQQGGFGAAAGIFFRSLPIIRHHIKYRENVNNLAMLKERAREIDEFAGGLGIADEDVDMMANVSGNGCIHHAADHSCHSCSRAHISSVTVSMCWLYVCVCVCVLCWCSFSQW